MQSCLFSGSVSEYLWELLDAFEIYITGIYFKKSISEDLEERAYERILNLIDSKDFDMEELKSFISLSDMKRMGGK